MGSGHAAAAVGDDPVARALDEAAHLLPDQGPIGVFVHHNTLHAFQSQPFHDAVVAGAAVVGAHPYLEEREFRAHWRAGRIEDADIDAAIAASVAPGGAVEAPIALGHTVGTLRRALLAEDLDIDDEAGLTYCIQSGAWPVDATRWDACAARVKARPPRRGPPADRPLRHRDALVARGADDTDVPVHAELQRLCSWFLDQGQALTPMPARDGGLLRAVAALYASGASSPRFAPGVHADFIAVHQGKSARELVDDALTALGVTDIAGFTRATLLALPGWAGMMSRLERHPGDLPHDPHAHLLDYLAVRLAYERHAVARACADAGLPIAWAQLVTAPEAPARAPIHDTYLLYRLTEGRSDVATAADADLDALFAAVDAFPPLARRRAFQEAYERRYRRQILDALAARRQLPAWRSPGRPRAQFVFCIDEREESIRRAIEEQDAGFETFGVAGFFGVAMDYQGIDDERPAAYCPVVVTPAHEIHEAPADDQHDRHQVRARLRATFNRFQRAIAATSRGVAGGALLSLITGFLAGIATLAWVLQPRHTVALRDGVYGRVLELPPTRLVYHRPDDQRSARGRWLGFTYDEMADRVAGTLRNIGLVQDFAPIVVILGHGSTSLNNPHESAHDCGACGGRRGGANARIFAEMANHPEVRSRLASRGVAVPEATRFVGALHDTSDDSVRYSDIAHLPAAFAPTFEVAWRALEVARRANAQERARRFHDAPLSITPDAALAHVEARAAHFAQPRPEYGHCTNAICVVGRRALTRGLHLDRRAFLVSYDPTSDANDAILERILAAVGPVGAGINLEYYFSSVDNEVFGCGTKLPHNVTGLIGVMNGHQSDLRTGLPVQMVELHEPMRLLLVVDATPEALLAIAGRQPEVCELVVNGWVQLVSADPHTGTMQVFENGKFYPYVPATAPLPRAPTSAAWHRQGRGHLPPALIEAALV
jgi:uncharacterized protein YbcC (UPF0753/DUF2309 family)